jgi:hypothetical protein
MMDNHIDGANFRTHRNDLCLRPFIESTHGCEVRATCNVQRVPSDDSPAGADPKSLTSPGNDPLAWHRGHPAPSHSIDFRRSRTYLAANVLQVGKRIKNM